MSNIITYSSISTFQACPRKYQYRYIDCLVPKGRDDNLYFGGLIHECLDLWYQGETFLDLCWLISHKCIERDENPHIKQMFHIARSMMAAYIELYESPDKRFNIDVTEKQFENGRIVNPNTGYCSKRFRFYGKVDGIVSVDGEYYLLEHKTAASINDNYIGRLWSDMQISLYTHYVRELLGIDVKGVLYNIMMKPTLKQVIGETVDQFEQRKLDAIEKSKSGKTSIKRKLPESDIEYEQRLAAWFKDGEKFISIPIIISDFQIKQTLDNLWYQKEHLLKCKRDNFYPQRLAECYTGQYRGQCAYAQLCESGNDTGMKELYYETKPPHSELNLKQKEAELAW